MEKKRLKVSHEVEEDDSSTVDVKFCSDNDVFEIIYVKGSKSQKIAEERQNNGSSKKCETPQNKRLAALRGSPVTSPSSGLRSSLRAGNSEKKYIDSISEEDETVEDDEDDPHIPLKPKELFPENDDQEDEECKDPAFFSNQRGKKGQMVQKAMDKAYKNSPSRNSGTITPTKPEVTTPKSKRLTPTCKTVTPKNSKVPQVDAKTPYTQRQDIKKNLASIMNDDDSDWDGESDSESSSEESEMDIDLAPTPPPVTTPRSRGRKPEGTPARTPSRTSSRVLNIKSTYKADDYFTSHGSKRVTTSDHTLNKLENPRLCPEKVQELLNTIPMKHGKEIKQLSEKNNHKFERWMLLLSEGFNLLLHGLGSKKTVLDDFRTKMLQDAEDVIVINGFFPSLTLRDILKTIGEVILRLDFVPADEEECCDLIVESYKKKKSDPLYILINNLDGNMLQGDKCQAILARLASVPSIHLIATIDHINAPLLFDLSLLSLYNFLWQDLTNFMPYTEETAYENSLLVHQSGALALASLHSVFQSLTKNAKEIFMLLVNRQLESEDPKYLGMAFRDLYHECREKFLVSSDLALRSQLTEFFDHQLVKNKRGHDGSDMLLIPIPKAALQEFCAMQKDD